MKSSFVLLRFSALFVAAALVSQLAACGQRGPLYLPSKPDTASTPAKTAPATSVAPAPTGIPAPK